MRASTKLTQERLQSVIRYNPGIHVRRISLLMGMSWNTVVHHLRNMERDGNVSSRKVEGKVCWFDRAAGVYNAKTGTALLRDPENLRLIGEVLEVPGRNQLQLAEATDLATSIVHRRIVKMEQAGLVIRQPVSRSVRVYPSDELPAIALRGGFLPDRYRTKIVPEVSVPVRPEVVEAVPSDGYAYEETQYVPA